MSFALTSKFKIGKFTFRGGVNDVVIKKSIYTLMDTATIKLPALSQVILKGSNLPASSLETAKVFKEGDPVKIELGYNGLLKTEFEGFVRRVNIGTPVVLELEGYGWQLRNKHLLKSWKNTSVKEVLKELLKGTDIVLSKAMPDVKLEKLYVPNYNGLEVLEYFKTKLHLSAYFNGPELYVGLEQGLLEGSAKYVLGWNVIRDDQLKYRLVEDSRVLVRVVRKLKKGEQLLYEKGEKDGSISTIKLPNITSEADIKKIGDEAYRLAKRTGYEGKITGFLQPYAEPGFKAIIEDNRLKERNGSFFVSSTEVRYGIRGARRIVEISNSLDG